MNPQPSTLNSPPSVQLHIERLVVDQSLISPGRGDQLQATIETELARLLTERGLTPLPDTAIPSLTARNIQVGDQSRPTQFGQQIAKAVYTTIGTENPPPSKAQPIGGAL